MQTTGPAYFRKFFEETTNAGISSLRLIQKNAKKNVYCQKPFSGEIILKGISRYHY
jgi:hypothetical protein